MVYEFYFNKVVMEARKSVERSVLIVFFERWVLGLWFVLRSRRGFLYFLRVILFFDLCDWFRWYKSTLFVLC